MKKSMFGIFSVVGGKLVGQRWGWLYRSEDAAQYELEYHNSFLKKKLVVKECQISVK